jgi:hypothetical protein
MAPDNHEDSASIRGTKEGEYSDSMPCCQVAMKHGTGDMLGMPGVQHLLISALLQPQALGIPHLEDQSCRSIAWQARVSRLSQPQLW